MATSGVPLMFQPLTRYADFNGRARRSEYWLWALFLFLLQSALSILQFSMIGANMAAMQGAHSEAAMASAMGASSLFGLFRLAVFLGLLLPSIAVAVRRMHDINRTGWWIVLPNTVMIIAVIAVISVTGADFIRQASQANSAASTDPNAAIAFFLTMMRAFLWIIVPTLAAKVVTFVFRVTEGTKGPNRFGPDPKGSAPTEVF